uniref:AH domain-containing protein n=1 Tax=Periophthalmus magnuspinnatus TaxID=409849 RepID=A0A3B3ZJJ3_9GOBI
MLRPSGPRSSCFVLSCFVLLFLDLPGAPPSSDSGGPIVLQSSNKNPASEKLERVRKWSITTYKCTRQALSEKLGRGSRTVDLELEPRLELLRDDRRRYDHVTKLTQTLANQITQLSVTQKALGDVFSELSVKTPTLHVEFGLNAEAQRFLCKSGETLAAAVNSFTSDMNTLINKTIEDTMSNAKQYEAVRYAAKRHRHQRHGGNAMTSQCTVSGKDARAM